MYIWCIHLPLYLFLYVCIENHEFTHKLSFLLMGFIFSCSIFITPFNNSEKPGSCYPLYIWVPILVCLPTWLPSSLCSGSKIVCHAAIPFSPAWTLTPPWATAAHPHPLARCLSCSSYLITLGMNGWERGFFLLIGFSFWHFKIIFWINIQ